MISPTFRFLLKPIFAVAQKSQSTAQPTCEETHKVALLPSGMRTISTRSPSPTSNNHFLVPSEESAVSHAALTNNSRSIVFMQSPGLRWNHFRSHKHHQYLYYHYHGQALPVLVLSLRTCSMTPEVFSLPSHKGSSSAMDARRESKQIHV